MTDFSAATRGHAVAGCVFLTTPPRVLVSNDALGAICMTAASSLLDGRKTERQSHLVDVQGEP